MSPEQTRYVIARQVQGEFLAGPVVPMLDLPDAEHVHVTRHGDGTYTAEPIERMTASKHEDALMLPLAGSPHWPLEDPS